MQMPFRKNKGFTLIEIIVSLIIVSIMATVAGLGVVQIAKTFVFAKDSMALAQQSQLAMTRLRISLQNLISISAAGDETITIKRRSPDGTLIEEIFTLSGNTLQVKSSDYDGYNNFYALADNVSSFSLSYINNLDNAWSTSDRINDLARIGISMSLSASEATSMTFVDEVYPANISVPAGFKGIPEMPEYGVGGPGCFVATAGFEDRNAMTVAWHHKAGLMIIVLFGWILFVLLKRHGTFKGLKLSLPVGQSGSILIGVIITTVLIAVLGAAMVPLFSSSSMSTIRFAYAQKAQYLAQSGLNYAMTMAGMHRDSDLYIQRKDLIDSLFLNQAFPVGNDQFSLSIEMNWFEESSSVASAADSLVVTAPGGIGPGNLPAAFQTPVGDLSSRSGDLRIEVPDASGSTYETVSYSGYSVDASSVTFTLSPSASAIPVDNAPVYPVARTYRPDSTPQQIEPVTYASPSASNLFISGNLTILPKVQGVLTISTPEGNSIILQYDSLDKDTGELSGLHCPPGVPSFTRSLPNQTVLTFNEFARFTSTGTVNMGADSVSRSITLFQPLTAAKLYRLVSGEMTHDKVRSVIGSHEGEDVDGDGNMAIKVTETEQVISAFIPEEVYMQESLGAVDWGEEEPNPLEALWEASESKLRYDLQTKIRFTDAEDDLSETDPLNHPGNYMPGLSFRVKGPLGGQAGDYSYYGLSIMRGIQGTTEYTTGSGCDEETYYTENDDIPDTLYDDHGSTEVADPIDCEGYVQNVWNDTPPFDGIPYLILWQKDARAGPGGCADATYTPWERMAYAPLVDYEEVTVYYKTVTVEDVDVAVIYKGTPPDGEEPIDAWELSDTYGLFKTYDVDDVTVLGLPGGEVVRDPATVSTVEPIDLIGKPVAGGENGPVGYIRPPSCTTDQCQTDKALYNYRIYPKEWITMMVNIYEMESCCEPATNVNALTAYFGNPGNDIGTSFGNVSSTDLDRRHIDRGDIKWPDQGDYFTQVIWGRGLADKKEGYTSKTVTDTIAGCGATAVTYALVEIGYDGAGNPTIVYSATFPTDEYDFATQDIPEFGAHTLGISANASVPVGERETVYFDDFAWRFMQGTGEGVVGFPGITTQ